MKYELHVDLPNPIVHNWVIKGQYDTVQKVLAQAKSYLIDGRDVRILARRDKDQS